MSPSRTTDYRRGLKAAVLWLRDRFEALPGNERGRYKGRDSFFRELVVTLLERCGCRNSSEVLLEVGYHIPSCNASIANAVIRESGILEQILDSGSPSIVAANLGWIYQYWNSPERDQATWAISRGANESLGDHEITFATQLYTEPYMAEFLSSRCLSAFEDACLSKIVIADPACGGGNILVAVFAELYRRIGQHVFDSMIAGHLCGTDIDPFACTIARSSLLVACAQSGASDGELLRVARALASSIVVVPEPCGALIKEVEATAPEKRYDVILTNPPFIGRRKLDPALREYLSKHYPTADGDLAAAFIVRCIEMLTPGGQLGVVTNDKWLRLRSYEQLRWSEGDFPGVFSHTTVKSLVELGGRAFHREADLHDGVGVALLHASKVIPVASSNLQYVDLTRLSSYKAKETLFSEPHRLEAATVLLPQLRIARGDIRQELLFASCKPLKYLSTAIPLEALASVIVGVQTNDDRRFVAPQWSIPCSAPGWVVHHRGGGSQRWFGLNRWMLNLEGLRNEQRSGDPIPVEEWFDKPGWSYSWFASGSLALREKATGWSFGRAAAAGVFVDDIRIVGFLNSPLGSLLASRLSGKVQFPEGVVRMIPIPNNLSQISPDIVLKAVEGSKLLSMQDPREAHFNPQRILTPVQCWEIELDVLQCEHTLLQQALYCAHCGEKELELLVPDRSEWMYHAASGRDLVGSIKRFLVERKSLVGVRLLDISVSCNASPRVVVGVLLDILSSNMPQQRAIFLPYMILCLQTALLDAVGHAWRGMSGHVAPEVGEISLSDAAKVVEETIAALVLSGKLPAVARSWLPSNLNGWISGEFMNYHRGQFQPFPLIVAGAETLSHTFLHSRQKLEEAI